MRALILLAYVPAVAWGLFADRMQWDSAFWPWSDLAFYLLLVLLGVALYVSGRPDLARREP